MRIGIGYDIHALKRGRRLVLGGVGIPHGMGPQGHSDGDALLHAIVDAALGAAGLGDIGDHFPDTDKRWKGASSAVFARETAAMLRRKGLRIVQIDSVLMLERPKLAAHKRAIRESVARAFGVKASDVNVKAKTNEGMGEIGRGKAVAATAVVLLQEV